MMPILAPFSPPIPRPAALFVAVAGELRRRAWPTARSNRSTESVRDPGRESSEFASSSRTAFSTSRASTRRRCHGPRNLAVEEFAGPQTTAEGSGGRSKQVPDRLHGFAPSPGRRQGTLVLRGPAMPARAPTVVIAYEGNVRLACRHAARDPRLRTMATSRWIVARRRVACAPVAATSRCATAKAAGRGSYRPWIRHCARPYWAIWTYAPAVATSRRSLPGPASRLTLDSGKGTLQCHVPDDLQCEVDARVQTGRIGNDFDFEVRQVGEFGAAMVG